MQVRAGSKDLLDIPISLYIMQVRAASKDLLDIPNLKRATKRGLCKKFKQAVDASGDGWKAADFKTWVDTFNFQIFVYFCMLSIGFPYK